MRLLCPSLRTATDWADLELTGCICLGMGNEDRGRFAILVLWPLGRDFDPPLSELSASPGGGRPGYVPPARGMALVSFASPPEFLLPFPPTANLRMWSALPRLQAPDIKAGDIFQLGSQVRRPRPPE